MEEERESFKKLGKDAGRQENMEQEKDILRKHLEGRMRKMKKTDGGRWEEMREEKWRMRVRDCGS